VSLGGHRLKEMDRRLSGWRLVEESDHQGQIDVKPQHVVRVNSPSAPNPATPLKDSDSFHDVPVVQSREDLPHQGFASPVIRFA
jgi:hypothetical protein